MKIGIDARFLGPEGTGIGTYLRELLKALEKIDQENQYLVLMRRRNWEHYIPSNPNFKKIAAEAQWYTIEEQLKMPRLLNKHRCDLYHFGHFNVPILWRGAFVVTIHDIILHKFKTREATTRSPLIYEVKNLVYRRLLDYAIRASRMILVPSLATKEAVLELRQVPAAKIAVTYEAADKKFFRWSHQEVSLNDREYLNHKYHLPDKYFLYAGNAYPHKNVISVLRALRKCPTANFAHICSNADNIFYRRMQQAARDLGVAARCYFPGSVTEQDLPLVFKGSQAYIFPSLLEGFGLPAIEAQAAGVPLLCSNAKPLPEVVGEGALYFNPIDPGDIADKINLFLNSKVLAERLVARGFINANRYSWEKTATQTLAVYKKAVNVS